MTASLLSADSAQKHRNQHAHIREVSLVLSVGSERSSGDSLPIRLFQNTSSQSLMLLLSMTLLYDHVRHRWANWAQPSSWSFSRVLCCVDF